MKGGKHIYKAWKGNQIFIYQALKLRCAKTARDKTFELN